MRQPIGAGTGASTSPRATRRDVPLDAAAYVATNRLDLSVWHPDVVALSFYKIFGSPTGVGCLLARRDPLAKPERPWLSGGTSVAGFVQRQYYQSAPGAAHFEDGNVNYLSLPAVEIGLRLLDRIGIQTIRTRVAALGAWLLDLLARSVTAMARPPPSPPGRGSGSSGAVRSPSTSCTPTGAWSTSARSTASRASTTSRCAWAVLRPWCGRGRSPARLCSAASSARG